MLSVSREKGAGRAVCQGKPADGRGWGRVVQRGPQRQHARRRGRKLVVRWPAKAEGRLRGEHAAAAAVAPGWPPARRGGGRARPGAPPTAPVPGRGWHGPHRHNRAEGARPQPAKGTVAPSVSRGGGGGGGGRRRRKPPLGFRLNVHEFLDPPLHHGFRVHASGVGLPPTSQCLGGRQTPDTPPPHGSSGHCPS